MQEDGIVYRDLFDTKIMSCLVGRPSEIIRLFHEEYEKSPSAAVDRQRNDPVILTRRMIDTTCITLVFHTKQTFRIAALLCQPCRRNRFGVFFRLGQIDRNIQIAVFRWRYPLFIPANTVSSNIVRVLTEFIKEIRRCFRGLFIFLMKPAAGAVPDRRLSLWIRGKDRADRRRGGQKAAGSSDGNDGLCGGKRDHAAGLSYKFHPLQIPDLSKVHTAPVHGFYPESLP